MRYHDPHPPEFPPLGVKIEPVAETPADPQEPFRQFEVGDYLPPGVGGVRAGSAPARTNPVGDRPAQRLQDVFTAKGRLEILSGRVTPLPYKALRGSTFSSDPLKTEFGSPTLTEAKRREVADAVAKKFANGGYSEQQTFADAVAKKINGGMSDAFDYAWKALIGDRDDIDQPSLEAAMQYAKEMVPDALSHTYLHNGWAIYRQDYPHNGTVEVYKEPTDKSVRFAPTADAIANQDKLFSEFTAPRGIYLGSPVQYTEQPTATGWYVLVEKDLHTRGTLIAFWNGQWFEPVTASSSWSVKVDHGALPLGDVPMKWRYPAPGAWLVGTA